MDIVTVLGQILGNTGSILTELRIANKRIKELQTQVEAISRIR